jgi:hypothetical protein
MTIVVLCRLIGLYSSSRVMHTNGLTNNFPMCLVNPLSCNAPYFINLLSLTPDNFTHQKRSSLAHYKWDKYIPKMLCGYITTLKNKQKLNVSSEGPSSRLNLGEGPSLLDKGPSLETSSFCLFFYFSMLSIYLLLNFRNLPCAISKLSSQG